MGGTAAVIEDTASNDCGEDEAAKGCAGGESADVLVGTWFLCHGCLMLVFDDGTKAAASFAEQTIARNNVWREIRLAILVQFG